MRLITQSELRTRRRCARLHHLTYTLGYRPRVDAAELRFGTLVHLALAAWWRAVGDRLQAALDAIYSTERDHIDSIRAEEILRGYHCRWADQDYGTIAVEAEFTAPLRNPDTGKPSRTYEQAGKLDVLACEGTTGRVLIVEHKTSSDDIRPGSDYWRCLRMDGQISHYYDGARALGYEPAACLYDVLGKPQHEIRQVPIVLDGAKVVVDANGERVLTKDGKKWRETADTALGYRMQTRDETADEFRARIREAIAGDPDRYYQRGEVVRLESDEAEHAADVWAVTRAMREDELGGRAPRNPDACRSYGRVCAFFDACTGCARLDDGDRFTRVSDPHQELTETRSNDNGTACTT